MEVIEHPMYPGYCPIPGNDYGVINRDGEILSTITGERLETRLNHKGYLYVNFRVNGKRTGRSVHRLLALTFVERPERHANTPYIILEVNHKDGVKTNNAIDNLEWVTAKENTEHAHKTGLTSVGKKIQARDVRTNIVTEWNSVSACAENYGSERKRMSKHLTSDAAGRVTLDWHVFRYTSDDPWPVVHPLACVESLWNTNVITLGINTSTGVAILANMMVEAAKLAGLNYSSAKSHYMRKGWDVPYEGWIFREFESMADIEFEELKIAA